MKRAPLVDPRSGFIWLPASSHSDPSKFLRRQRKRMAEADAARKDVAADATANVIDIKRSEEAKDAQLRG